MSLKVDKSYPHSIEMSNSYLLLAATLEFDPTTHPLHLHGYKMQFLECGTRNEFGKGNPAYRNLTRMAPYKDTIMVPNRGYAITRFRATNPGYWLMHCHIELHMHAGMKMTVKVGAKHEMHRPPPRFPVCGSFLA